MSIQVTNLLSGAAVTYSLPILAGEVTPPLTQGHLKVTCFREGRARLWPIYNGQFKVLVPLQVILLFNFSVKSHLLGRFLKGFQRLVQILIKINWTIFSQEKIKLSCISLMKLWISCCTTMCLLSRNMCDQFTSNHVMIVECFR